MYATYTYNKHICVYIYIYIHTYIQIMMRLSGPEKRTAKEVREKGGETWEWGELLGSGRGAIYHPLRLVWVSILSLGVV